MGEPYDQAETLDPFARDKVLFTRLNAALARARAEQPYWADRLKDSPERVDDWAGLSALPVLRKSDLSAMQKAAPPFGGLTATERGQLRRLFISPGPIFDPEGKGPDWWGAARALHAAGLRQGDVVLNTFSYHLTPAAFMFESGAEAIGCAVIPTGPGNTADQLIAIEQFQPSGYVGTPDFLKIILDKGAEQGTDTSSLRLALVSGAALPESLRLELAGRGVQVRQCYGTADLGIVAYEGDGPGMVVNEGVLLEIVRPGTGEPVPDGEVGEVVVTRLSPDYPLFRFATGDLSAILSGPSDDGRTNRRIRGWLGRADQATKVKGMFVRPEQVAAVARSVAGTGKVRLVVKREGEQDRMELWAEHAAAAAADPLGAKLAEVTKLKGVVRIVPPGTLPNDGKVIADER
ncbi:AMP-dependent synthetase [Haematobacter massiliensis]|uniref:AMP-dependent synthetase n=1 Tax=Haematobacter massiliensis TaxID=195105 RepID=A0A086YCN9_9RHOB|nr:AMP-binding protein [Haematobacter massiliensis]KFI32039.1 AMP-dependent synthetase [Haematobacter massiliensis]OWJ72642.1 AMP-dependent synthetase [Haematobacter massiliensis]OWJ86781.1 AMP-dependent synthetase [Haematobacter massiliensis]QBJ24425.1 phenylacetate--CoA ligase family protein [Haematobacter massiliensis]